MKFIFIFAILCLPALARAGIDTELPSEEKNVKEMLNGWMTECAGEVVTWEEFNGDLTCMLGCGLRKISNASGTNLHDGLLELVDLAYKYGFETTKFTREEVESKINNCFAQGDEECKQFACLYYENSPVADVLSYDFKLFMEGPFKLDLLEVVKDRMKKSFN